MVLRLLEPDKENALRTLSKNGWTHLKERDAISKNFEFGMLPPPFHILLKKFVNPEF